MSISLPSSLFTRSRAWTAAVAPALGPGCQVPHSTRLLLRGAGGRARARRRHRALVRPEAPSRAEKRADRVSGHSASEAFTLSLPFSMHILTCHIWSQAKVIVRCDWLKIFFTTCHLGGLKNTPPIGIYLCPLLKYSDWLKQIEKPRKSTHFYVLKPYKS
jgi:hypothetical protein